MIDVTAMRVLLGESSPEYHDQMHEGSTYASYGH
jgi:hypothetical protein